MYGQLGQVSNLYNGNLQEGFVPLRNPGGLAATQGIRESPLSGFFSGALCIIFGGLCCASKRRQIQMKTATFGRAEE